MNVWSLERLARASNLPWSGQPFGMKIGRAAWAAATDSKWFVGVCGAARLEEPPWTPEHQKRFVAFFRQTAPEGALSGSLDDVREWAGTVPLLGEPFERDTQRPGVAAGVVVDQRRLAALLTSAPDDGHVLIWNATEAMGVSSVALDVSGRWRAILAGLNDEPCPEYETLVPTQRSPLDAFAHLE